MAGKKQSRVSGEPKMKHTTQQKTLLVKSILAALSYCAADLACTSCSDRGWL